MAAEQQSGGIVPAVPTFPVFRTAPDRGSKKKEHYVGKETYARARGSTGFTQVQTRMGSVSQIRMARTRRQFLRVMIVTAGKLSVVQAAPHAARRADLALSLRG